MVFNQEIINYVIQDNKSVISVNSVLLVYFNLCKEKVNVA